MADSTDQGKRTSISTLVLLILIVLLFGWYVVADRVTPTTGNARLQAYVVPVVPDVSGYVAEVKAKKNTLVEAGADLVQIETARFENAVKIAEAELEAAGQDLGASTASVSTATASISSAQAKLTEVRAQAARIFELEEKGIYAKAKGDQARAEVQTAEAAVAAAEAEQERAKQVLGVEGDENPRVQLALAKLANAQLDLARTSIVSPVNAIVGTLKIEQGAFAAAGQPLMTLISMEDFWIEAYLTENNLSYVNPGDKVEIAFDAFPGKIFTGKVKSTAYGVSTGKAINLGDLPTAAKSRNWLRDPQRFPVVIETTDYEWHEDPDKPSLRYNSQLDVVIYTQEGGFWNTLGAAWIRIVAYASYLY